jgi:hypothetical protein
MTVFMRQMMQKKTLLSVFIFAWIVIKLTFAVC